MAPEIGGCIHNTSLSSSLKNQPNTLVLYNTNLERLARDRQTSLLGSFERYEENEVL